jgi:Protein of unknown function (DUF3987)/BT4734-like, N-terminal domain
MNMVCSMVRDAVSTETRDVSAEAILRAIKTGQWVLPIEQIRTMFDNTFGKTNDSCAAKLAVEHLKKSLPGVMWCGQYSNRERPAADKLQKHSGLFCGDLDSLGQEELENTRAKLKPSPHLYALFVSPTGHGLKAVFRAPADPAKHAGIFRAVRKHVRDLTGLAIDESGKDLARLCFVSFDPDLYHNPDATELEPLPEPEKPKATFPDRAVNLSERQRIASELLGNVEWTSETSGFVQCPGKHLHTTGEGDRDCEIHLDGVPTVHCFHDHCRGILEGVNHELRSRIGKAEFVLATRAQAQPRNGEPVELLPPPAPCVPPPLDLLPAVLQDYVHAAAESLNVDVSFILVPLLSALGSAIGNSRSIFLKRNFIQPPVIWSAIIGRSGSRKSPALEAACFAVVEHERELMRQNKQAMEIYENALAEWESKSKKERGAKPQTPLSLTCLMDDMTLEALADAMQENPRGVQVKKDELSHWFAAFDQYRASKGADVSRWLSLHTGVLFGVDRRSDKRRYRIHQPRVCIAGGIQPQVLRRVLTQDFFERGLPARFLSAHPPMRQDKWSEAEVSDDLRARVLELFGELWLLQPDHDDKGEACPKLLRLDPDAQAEYVRYYNECGASAVQADEHEEAAWHKLSGYAARLALVGQLACDPDAKTVTGETMRAACDLARWFGNEAARIYASLAETQEQRERRELIEFIERRGGDVYERDVMQSFTRLKNDKPGTERELTALVKAGIGKWEPIDHGGGRGRPTRKFQLLRSSTSTQFGVLPGEMGNSVDVDSTSSQKITPSREPDTEAETLVGDELGVGRL